MAGNWKVVVVNLSPQEDLSLVREQVSPIGGELQRVSIKRDDELLAVAADADVIVPRRYPMRAGVIANLSRCRLIPAHGIGYDRIDVEAATARGILVTNAGDIFTEEVANHTWMLLLMVARHGLWQHNQVATNRWREAYSLLDPILTMRFPRVTGQTLGLVAFGNIARAVARRAHAFGMTCLAFDPYVAREVFEREQVTPVSLDDLFKQADFISCHLPLSPETLHAIGEAQFRLAKPSAIFINTGRGKVVDERALIAALEEGRIAGAGLDVFEQEPPHPDNPLLRMPNVVLSLHKASLSDTSPEARERLLGRQIHEALEGRIPPFVVNRQVEARWLTTFSEG